MVKGNEGLEMGYTASVEYLSIAMNYAQNLGLDITKIYKKAGFDTSILKKPCARISIKQLSDIWDSLEDEHPDPDLGLHLGETIFNFPCHILFLVMLNAPTVKDVIEKFCGYFNLLTDGFSPSITIDKNSALLSVRFNETELEPSRQVSEGVLATFNSVLNRVSENKIQLKGAYFIHSRPENISEHHRIFRTQLFFDQMENKLVFDKSYLDLPLKLSNREVYRNLEHLARKLQESIYIAGPWRKKVTQSIIGMLNREKPGIEMIARELAVSPRNLQNRLKEEGVSYRKLLGQVRKEQAVYFLKNEDIPISEIGLQLGYSEQSVFSRAFKRWVGTTPGQYRSVIKPALPENCNEE